ncbi:MAG: nucleoid occlusion protein [Clostridiales bacterium]|nr:nucleoid occlusion protein [Clostridiales bacterium]
MKSLQNRIKQVRREEHVLEKIPVMMIKPNPYQPRKNFSQKSLEELSHSITKIGLIQPISVRKTGINGYELIAGERRLRACKMAGIDLIPAIVISGDERDSAIMAMIENLQREDLHYLEEARGYLALIQDHGLTQEELAKNIGKSQSTIANKIRLLRLSDKIKEILIQNNLTERHARCLLRLPEEELRLKALNKIVEKEYNVKDSEMLIEKIIEKIHKNGKAGDRRKITGGYRDIRIFINTIKNAVVMMKDYGITPLVKEVDTGETIEITVSIPKN